MASLVRIQLRNVSKVSTWPSVGCSSCRSWGPAGAGGVKASGWTLLPPCLVENWGLGDGRLNPPQPPAAYEVPALGPQQTSRARQEKSLGRHPRSRLPLARFWA